MRDRYKMIMDLCENDVVSVNELVEKFQVSASTIRRDLAYLEEKGLITRVYGGARISKDQIAEKSNDYKALSMAKEKELIARYAASLVHEGDIVYVDAGTTTSKIIKYITCKDVLIVTQSLDCLTEAVNANFKVYMAGGYIKKRTNTLISTETVEKIGSMNFNISFVAGNGVHALTGFTCPDELEALLKKTALNRALKSYLCIDSTKFNKLTLSKFADLEKANVITDNPVPGFDYSPFNEIVFTSQLTFKK